MASFRLLGALAMLSTVAGLSTSVEPTIVRVLVPSAVTVLPMHGADAHPTLQARQWEAPSAPAWSEPAPMWSAPPVASWTQPAWTSSAAPTTAPSSAPTKWPENKALTKTNYILAAIIVGGIFGGCILFGIIGCILLKCHRRKNARKVEDVELASNLRPGTAATNGTTATGGERSTLGSVNQHAPQREHSALDPASLANASRQQVHWPADNSAAPPTVDPKKQPTHIRWSRAAGQSGGYHATG
ncbi:hypothetical protein NX059_002838 [Plenodomus lindquistii]|nr:hypothetical protein NX059_002838 [Plenodomus lindquistii]